jgi:hypothetical protein
MANGTNPRALRFSKTLRGHLEAQGGSVHGLARKIADKRFDGHAPRKMVEQARRDLNRYLSGRFNPGTDKRREIAAALGLEANALDEEEDMLLALINSMIRLREHKIRTGDPHAVLK